MKSWAVEGSNDEASWTEIDRRENNKDLNGKMAVKTFAVSRSRSFRRIRLLQTGPNHRGDNCLRLSAFELFGTIAGLPDDFAKFCFPMAPFKGIISHLTAKCGGNVHDRGIVEITASSAHQDDFGDYAPRNIADLGTYSFFRSENKPGQWICLDFKTVRIEPTHYTIRTGKLGHLKSWAVEGSDDGVSWTEIDRRENNSDLSRWGAVKTFAISQSVSFKRIRLCQTGLNFSGSNSLALEAFEVFGAVAGLQ
jgi:hypothetical protein